jgi:diguanylate cyclase
MAQNLNRRKIGRNIALLVILFGALGAIGFFEPATLAINSLQAKIRSKPVSGEIVVVGIDPASISEVGRWPWPRTTQAGLFRKIDSYNPKAVFIDIGYQGKTTTAADHSLRKTLETMKSPTTVVALAAEEDNRAVRSIYSHKNAIGITRSVTAYFPYLFGYVWTLPTTINTERGKINSMATAIVGSRFPSDQNFRIDYSFDPKTIPIYAAKDILAGTTPIAKINGKIVVIGVTDITQNDVHSMPGWGEKPGVLFHVLGAETLKNGFPVSWGWLPLFLIAIIIAVFNLTHRGLQHSTILSWSGVTAILAVSSWLTVIHIGNDPVPAIMLLTSIGIYVGRQKAALMRAQRNEHTGFADMTGYRVKEVVSNALFVGATIKRSETRLGYVLEADEMKIMKEVARRLSTVLDERQLTHNTKQQFLWEMPLIDTARLGAHLEGLRKLFSAPLVIDGRKIDVDIFFGIDRDVNDNIERRMKSALNTSIIARDSESTFKIATSGSYEKHLARHFGAEFTNAIANGDVQFMFAAQQQLSNGRITAAEIELIWNHPAYGELSGEKLISLATASGDLDKVSQYLCKQASHFAGKINKIWPGFSIIMKVPVGFISGDEFKTWMTSCMKATHFKTNSITFNLIDVHAHRMEPVLTWSIRNIQNHGFKVGIGNFGITTSDIDLINLFKPNELFLSKNFSTELLGSKGNKIYAKAALRIATETNTITTAKGIDDRDVLAELKEQGCDRAQGKIIAIALTYKDFIAYITTEKAKKTG